MATLIQIQAKLAKLRAQADALIAKQSSTALEKIRDLMAKHNLTIADIHSHAGDKKRGPRANVKTAAAKKTSAVQYQDPETGVTWSGHGRAPGWIATAKDRSKFIVSGNKTKAAASVVSKTKATGNYVRGIQPAMYRDPKSGATWSGRGRAPAWLTGVKDRSRLLIDGAAFPGKVETTSKPKAAARRVASRKAAV